MKTTTISTKDLAAILRRAHIVKDTWAQFPDLRAVYEFVATDNKLDWFTEVSDELRATVVSLVSLIPRVTEMDMRK